MTRASRGSSSGPALVVKLVALTITNARKRFIRQGASLGPAFYSAVVSDDDLVARFWHDHRLPRQSGGAARSWQCLGEVDERLDGRPGLGSGRLAVDLAEAASSDAEAGFVGAGPIEELVARRARAFDSPEGQALLEELDAAARRSRRFRTALASVFFDDEVPKQVRDRLERFR